MSLMRAVQARLAGWPMLQASTAGGRILVIAGSLTAAMLVGEGAFAQTPPSDQTPAEAVSVPGPAGAEQILRAPGTSQPAPSVLSLFGDAVKDFRHVASSDNFKTLAIGGAVAFAVSTQDTSVARRVVGTGTLNAFRPGRMIGGAYFQVAGAAATFALGRVTGSSNTAWLGADLLRAEMVAQTMTGVLKVSTGRTRPDGGAYSFPSGHSSTSFATATVLQSHFGLKAGIPAYAVASYVAASRVQMKRHYLSDVAFGAAVGIVAGRSVTMGRGTARFAVAPTVVASGGGIAFTWVGGK